MNKIILYHGSPEIIDIPIYGKGKKYNDYGQGFYCTENIELAKEWACSENIDGFVNKYELDITNLTILNLSDEKYTILHWITLLIEHRQFRITTPLMKKSVNYLKEHFLIDISNYDLVIGYRADDSYFSFARAFLNNEISLTQLSYSMRLGELGEQIVLISPKAFANIKFISYSIADNQTYYTKRKIRDYQARENFRKEAEKDDINGIYIRDILRKEITGNDPLIR